MPEATKWYDEPVDRPFLDKLHYQRVFFTEEETTLAEDKLTKGMASTLIGVARWSGNVKANEVFHDMVEKLDQSEKAQAELNKEAA